MTWTRSVEFISTLLGIGMLLAMSATASASNKPMLHGKHWMAITGKPLAATAGARIFHQGGNAVDAACAMLAATSTMFDVLSWGGETQALIYHPQEKRVIGINALGVAPSGATPEFFAAKGLRHPPEYGPLAAVTPGTPGGLLVMLANYGSMSLAEVLAPAMEMAEGYPMEAQTADSIERMKETIRQWPASERLFLTHAADAPGRDGREAPDAGEIFKQADLYRTLALLVEAEQEALAAGMNRKNAILQAYTRFYRGDIAERFVAGSQALGGLHTVDDLAGWDVHIESPVMTTYKDIEVYKLTSWVQGPVMLQALNLAEQLDLKSMGFNSANYIHHVYQIISMAFADRDFYYGDPYRPPQEPMQGLLSKKYANARLDDLDSQRNDPLIKPGNPYRFQRGQNPYQSYLDDWTNISSGDGDLMPPWQQASLDGVVIDQAAHERGFLAGTTSIQTADANGWVVSVTPSGGWVPATIAGDTGIGMSQRMQSFVVDKRQNPFNVVQPGQRPRATLTPGMALKGDKPWLSFAVQGGDIQDQVLLQFFLGIVEFGMNVQEATEAPYFWSYQLRNSFGDHRAEPGKVLLNEQTPAWVRKKLEDMGYLPNYRDKTSGPINAIMLDHEQGTFLGGSSDFGEDYGIAW